MLPHIRMLRDPLNGSRKMAHPHHLEVSPATFAPFLRRRARCETATDTQERPIRMSIDTPGDRFHNFKMAEKASKERPKTIERALEEAVSRALRDNLAPLQRTADELQQAYADLVAACSSSRPTNALPAMLRAQTAASALAAGLSVLSNFVAVALNPRDRHAVEEEPEARESSRVAVQEVEEEPPAPAPTPATAHAEPESEWAGDAEDVPVVPVAAKRGTKLLLYRNRPLKSLRKLPRKKQSLLKLGYSTLPACPPRSKIYTAGQTVWRKSPCRT